jgi:hypothetical protein
VCFQVKTITHAGSLLHSPAVSLSYTHTQSQYHMSLLLQHNACTISIDIHCIVTHMLIEVSCGIPIAVAAVLIKTVCAYM